MDEIILKPTYLIIAEAEVGQHEIKNGENERIVAYHATTTLKATDDETPWCSSFVNWCVTQAGFKGTNNALAKSWLKWGVELAKPDLGCICVIKQHKAESDNSTGTSTGYHVAFWLGEVDGRVKLLGGNQSDQVKISTFGLKSYDIIGYRIPKETVATGG